MHFLTMTVAAFAGLAVAAPAPGGPQQPPADPGSVYVKACQEPGWQGECLDQPAELYHCYRMDSFWNNTISAIGPRSGYCKLYDDKDCKKNPVICPAPGIGDLRWVGIDNKISSFICKPYWWE